MLRTIEIFDRFFPFVSMLNNGIITFSSVVIAVASVATASATIGIALIFALKNKKTKTVPAEKCTRKSEKHKES